MSEGRARPIGEIAEVKGGKRLPKGHSFIGAGQPYIRARDIKGGRIEIIEPVFLASDTARTLGRYTVRSGDVCIVIVGANVGDVGAVPTTLDGANLTENAVKLTDLTNTNPTFLKYALLHGPVQREMKAVAAGAAQPKLGIYKIKALRVPHPMLDVQERIAEVLSAYDDLIGNNNRRMALLEEAIHLLYREWFVYLRFPGHDRVEKVDGVPGGWTRKPLREVCSITMGQSPKSEFYNEEGRGLPFHQGVRDYGDRFVRHRIHCTVENRIGEPGDILFSVRAPVGRLNITKDRVVIGRGLSAIRRLDGRQSFQFYQLKTHFHQEDLIGGGTIFASVTKKNLLDQEMLVPTEHLIEEFDRVASEADRQILNLDEQNQRLREARDLLLTRLMNGSIAV